MIELGELRMSATGWRRFLLFQSLSQFLSWAAIIVLVIVVGNLVVTAAGGHHLALVGPVAGGIAGSLPSVWLTRHARFCLRGPGRARALGAIEDGLRVQRYRPDGVDEGTQLYRLNLPRLLRWGEQEVRLALRHDEMVVSGPWVALRFLRRYLAADLADQLR